jgi:hypothetical protein
VFDVTFVSPRTGKPVAAFTHQTRREVQLLFAKPPSVARLCSAEMRVRPC